ncbi:TrgA family protein [Puniceibacterium sp. IMCC21224]|uniref:TrgA family protein n=1 Tax=Puniceibacterium sp. IMCC21224 TaxID=1618204 RepID=UPI00064DEAD4|nr:TrgA family protein [Puniceibacterium sp. IMCC21224]KMK67541.1 hypothetical protein IMCC21224_112412 [Puniceibacterium sp. IMCC21224]
MPTAAKLLSALCLAALGYYVSEMIKQVMPESTAFGVFSYVNAALGAICGWRIVGSRAGRGLSAGISNGLTGVVALVFWGIFVQACNEMVRLAMINRFDGPMEAFAAVFELGIKYGQIILTGPIIGTLVVGALIVGLVGEFAASRYR